MVIIRWIQDWRMKIEAWIHLHEEVKALLQLHIQLLAFATLDPSPPSYSGVLTQTKCFVYCWCSLFLPSFCSFQVAFE